MHPRRRLGSLHVPLFDHSLRSGQSVCPWATSSGYRTATIALYVSRDTPELFGNMTPHLWWPFRPAASTVSAHSGSPNSSGAVAINITVRCVVTRVLVIVAILIPGRVRIRLYPSSGIFPSSTSRSRHATRTTDTVADVKTKTMAEERCWKSADLKGPAERIGLTSRFTRFWV